MAKKRGAGEGSIYQVPGRGWRGKTRPDPSTGKAKYVSGKSQAEVIRKLAEANRALDRLRGGDIEGAAVLIP